MDVSGEGWSRRKPKPALSSVRAQPPRRAPLSRVESLGFHDASALAPPFTHPLNGSESPKEAASTWTNDDRQMLELVVAVNA
jgi:hypothetical protein